ncbi:hypothetical protein MKW94_006241 [Papaver nudicaule]|uniref:Uncharacterized protein n=1 Tax=Papaver nudicaule TaxID=74823 RepID=A0AA41V6K8_PAPNU|nr:hypothetical protein [Papaver nudicaule]
MEFLQDEKNKLCSGIKSFKKEKAKLETDFELLNQKKDKLESEIEFLNEDKAEFIRSAIQEMNQTLVAKERFCTEELQEARQELIKVMVSEKVTRDGKIGVKTVRKGEQVLWNFREGRRASLKEVIRLQLNHTNK